MYSFMIPFVLLTIVVRTALTEVNLHDQNSHQENLNPVSDYDYDNVTKDQDKRTIFTPTVSDYGWAKHIGVNPSGMKYVIGYGPVDLKYVPVIKPVSIRHEGYHYPRPHFDHDHHYHHHHLRPVHLKPFAPHIEHIHGEGWRPVVKPIVPVNIPPAHVVTKPWHHHHHFEKPVTIGKPVVPVQPVQPIVPVQPVHHVPVVKPIHIRPIRPVVPVQHVPSVPVGPSFKPILTQPFVPSPALFEVTRPNLGVLPLGAAFPSPVLHQFPGSSAALPLPQLKPGLLPQAPVLPHPIAPHAHLHPQYPPGTVVEFHGTHNFIPIDGRLPHAPVLPQTPIHAQFPQLFNHHHHHLQPQIPPPIPSPPHEQHDVQTPFLPANHPNFFQQQLPDNNEPHFFNHNVHTDQPQVFNRPNLDLPNIQQFHSQQIIQPGQTDVQLPLQLPHHHFVPDGRQFQAGNFHDPSQYPENIFMPSISLEPPFVNRRRSASVQK